MASILIIDDEENIRRFLQRPFEKRGHDVYLAENGTQGLEIFGRHAVDVVILDINLPGMKGLEVLSRLKDMGDPVVIMITAYGDVETAVGAMRRGAFHYICKPFEFAELEVVVEEAFRVLRMRNQLAALEYRRDHLGYGDLVGRSPQMQAIYETIEKVAPTNSTVFIIGESGTGKELVAQAIHRGSPRTKETFLPINCTAIGENVLESELFGHEKGAYTDARETKRGLFEIANGGTLLLDEIGDMDLHLQGKLLRFLEEREFRRLGGTRTIRVDVRILASTNRNLLKELEAGRFREDLYYRLNVVSIPIPPLRERGDDIPLLAEHFLSRFNREFGKKVIGFTPEAREALLSYSWPGNVRELRNVCERTVLLSVAERVGLAELPSEITGMGAGAAAPLLPEEVAGTFQETKVRVLERFERSYLEALLRRHEGNVSQSAVSAGMDRTSLQRLLRKHSIQSEDFRK